MDWWVHRIATSEHYRCQPWQILERWSWAETLEAHETLDYIADLHAEEEAARPKKAP